MTTHLLDDQGTFIRDVDTSFAVNLKRLAWLPGIETQSTSDPNGKCVVIDLCY